MPTGKNPKRRVSAPRLEMLRRLIRRLTLADRQRTMPSVRQGIRKPGVFLSTPFADLPRSSERPCHPEGTRQGK